MPSQPELIGRSKCSGGGLGPIASRRSRTRQLHSLDCNALQISIASASLRQNRRYTGPQFWEEESMGFL